MYAKSWPTHPARSASSSRFKSALARRLSLFFITSLLPLSVWSMPPVLEPVATLTPPEPRYTEIESVAIDGDFAVVAYAAEEWDTEEDEYLVTHTPVIYRRNSNSTWQYIQTLPPYSYLAEYRRPAYVALRGNIVAHVPGELRVFERTATGWQTSPVQLPAVEGEAWDVDIDNGTVLVAAGACQTVQAQAFRKNASGTWVRAGTGLSDATSCDLPSYAQGAISGNTALLAAPRLADRSSSAIHFFNGAPSNWTMPAQTIGYEFDRGVPIALSGDFAVLYGRDVFQRSGGVFNFKQRLEREEFGVRAVAAQIRGNLSALAFDRSVSIFQRSATSDFSEIARLTRPGGKLFASTLDLSGRRVIALDLHHSRPEAFIYEVPPTLPAQPTMIQDTFQSGNAARWTPLAGGSWSVATTAASRVYRQTHLAGDATSILSNSDWTNQSIQADVRPTAFFGNDRWFGLAVRRVDAANYYYLTARSSGTVQLKKMVNGVFQTLASTNLSVLAGSDYRLRLEAIGTTITAYVNGVELLTAVDSSLRHGQAALMTYKTAAYYDNVIVSPSPQTTLFMDDEYLVSANLWTRVAGQWSTTPWPDAMHVQSSTAGGASSVTGNSTTDQSISARIQETAVGSGTQPWFGLFARYRDANNYYYVTVRNSNEISLRRLLNGATQVLDSAPFGVSTGTWYSLRLEAVEDQLRVYVGNRLILEAADESFSEGRYGMVMYKAATVYGDVVVTRP